MPKRAVENASGKRVALNMKTTQEVRAKLEEAAGASGRSLTAEVEHRLAMSFEWEAAFVSARDMLESHKEKMKQLDSDNSAAALRRLGWTVVRGYPEGTAYFRPGTVEGPRSGFIDPAELERLRPSLEERVERIERTLEQAGLALVEEPSP